MSICRSWILCAAGATALLAQQGTIGGPVAGYVFDSTAQSLRAIRGIPGAALIGDGLDLGSTVTSAWVAPRQDAALLVTAEGTPRLVRLDSGKVTALSVDGLLVPEQAIFSPSGTALALVTVGSVRIVKGLPDAPVIAGTMEIPGDRATQTAAMNVAKVSGRKLTRPTIGTMAVSDDGGYLLFQSGQSVQVLSLTGGARSLTEAAPNALLAFAPNGHDAAIVDASAVGLFQDVAGASTVRRLPGLAGGKGAGYSPDGRKLFVAGAGVQAIDVATGDRTEIACGCQPDGLTRMGSAFRMNDLGTEPLWLLDASAEPKVLFVPARSAK